LELENFCFQANIPKPSLEMNSESLPVKNLSIMGPVNFKDRVARARMNPILCLK